jgi:hypothetical protein
MLLVSASATESPFNDAPLAPRETEPYVRPHIVIWIGPTEVRCNTGAAPPL